ncbi:hypothetical protein LCGC14_1530880 [marine sediment metagenome]|uniref:Uncharacterized protein n=1 Tax=marine sediment metagenome TaxID=412755 RepID=A0A0F9IW48_9ZZZZ
MLDNLISWILGLFWLRWWFRLRKTVWRRRGR